MKSVIVMYLMLVATATSANELPDWVGPEDRAAIDVLAQAGLPHIEHDSQFCAGPLADFLGAGENGRPLCVERFTLPSAVFTEIREGNAHRFVNVSDYDQRVTRLYAFEHGGTLSRHLATDDLAALIGTFDIPLEAAPTLAATPYIHEAVVGSSGYLSPLSGLYVGTEWQEQSASYEYAMAILEGADTTTYSWQAEVTLYPGGGFTTAFHVIVTDKHLLFIKIEGWNS